LRNPDSEETFVGSIERLGGINKESMPWHPLGTRLAGTQNAGQAVRTAGLNWTVTKKKIRASGKRELPFGGYVLVRNDLWERTEGGILGPIRPNHTPIQNIDAFKLFDPIVETGAVVYDSAGAWGQGEYVWMILRLRGEAAVLPNDLVARFFLFGHTPNTGQHRMAYLPVRLACRNTLSESAFHNPTPLVTTPDVRPRQFKAPAEIVLQEIEGYFENLLRHFRAMAKIQLSKDQLETYLDAVFKAWARTRRKVPAATEEIEHGFERCRRLFRDGRGNDLTGARGTLWAAYSGVTEYVDYHKTAQGDWRYLREIWFSSLKACALEVAKDVVHGRRAFP
jgi:phage/plasmid-like protein (TIGR03299 family)